MTDLERVEQQLEQESSTEGLNAFAEHSFTVGAMQIRVARAVDRKGMTRYRYWVDGYRVERKTLQTLICSNIYCPTRQQLLKQWQEFRSPRKSLLKTEPVLFVHRLAEEIELEGADGRRWIARRAKLRVPIRCPEDAHAPLVAQVDAWDLFNHEGYVAGGLNAGKPLFHIVNDIREWIDAAKVQMQADAQLAL